jgi:hypothetical protein
MRPGGSIETPLRSIMEMFVVDYGKVAKQKY